MIYTINFSLTFSVTIRNSLILLLTNTPTTRHIRKENPDVLGKK